MGVSRRKNRVWRNTAGALKREIREELASEISVGELIDTVEFDYPTFHLSMDCFWCQLIRGNLELLEAAEARWLTKETLKSVDCCRLIQG